MVTKRLAWFAVFALAGNLAMADGAAPFPVFDGLLYQGKPDLAALGMQPIRGVNPPVSGNQSSTVVEEPKIRATLQTLKDYTGVVYLDYEQWQVYQVPAGKLAENVQKLIQVARIAHAEAPNAKFGFYGLPPCWDYWNVVRHVEAKLVLWRQCNANLDDVAASVDVIMPSLYTFYYNQSDWDVYAAAQITAARRYHKPVYVFLWPEFHVSNPVLRGTNIPAGFWRHELEFCKQRADGIVIWGGWQKQWDERSPWWIETKAFLDELKSQR